MNYLLKLLQSSQYKHIEPAKVCALSAETVVSKPPIIFQTLYQRSQEKGAFTITFSQNIYPTTEHILYYERYILLQNRSPITKDISYYKTNPLLQKVYPITEQIPYYKRYILLQNKSPYYKRYIQLQEIHPITEQPYITKYPPITKYP